MSEKHNNELKPIGRLKYFIYSLIAFIILHPRSDNIVELLIVGTIFGLMIMPVLIVKRAKDIGISIKWALGIYFVISLLFLPALAFGLGFIVVLPMIILQLRLLFETGTTSKQNL